jgi:hypothetical protein
MSANYCYWSIGTGSYADLLVSLVDSARSVGVTADFHVWTNRDIPGAICHPAGEFDNWGWLFKLVFLRREVALLDYDYFVFLDADSWFVRHPGDPGQLLQGSPMHVTLEADLVTARKVPVWWEYPAEHWVRLMRSAGVRGDRIHTVNAGMFIVQRSAIPLMYQLALEFWRLCRRHGVLAVDEPLLAYAMQMLCNDPAGHTLPVTHRLWATDTDGAFAHQLPDGRPFRFTGYHRQHQLDVDPAIVHLLHGKSLLFDHARQVKARITAPQVVQSPR